MKNASAMPLRLHLLRVSSSRRLALIFLLVLFVCAACRSVETSASSKQLVTYEIRYRLPQAGEVFLVWGVDGWGALPSADRPPGTTIRDRLMYTPMIRSGDLFTVRLQVPPDAGIDYVFQVTQTASGLETDIWDINNASEQKYRSIATADGVTEVLASTSIANAVARRSMAGTSERRTLSWMLLGLGLTAAGFTRVRLPGWRSFPRAFGRGVNWQLVLILAGAALMRINYITQPFVDTFSWRQVSVAMMAENYHLTNPNIFYPEVNWSGPGPNYQGREFQTVSYLAALLYPLTGQQDWVGRAIAIVFGLWGIFALYQLVRSVWDDEHAALAAAMMAVLPGSISVERSFLPDPAMVALVVTSFWLLVTYLQTERWRYLVLASLIGAWGFCTKIPGLIVCLPMVYAVFAIWGWRKMFRPANLRALIFFAVATLLPVTVYYLWARHLALTYPPHHFAGDGNWLWDDGLRQWLAQSYFLPVFQWLLIYWLWTLPVIALIAVSLVIRPPAKADPSVSPSEGLIGAPWLFHFWLLAGLIYYLIGAKELVNNAWNFHILNPMAAALASHGLLFLGGLISRLTRRSVTGLLAAVALVTIGLYGYRGLDPVYEPRAEEAYLLGLALREVSAPGDLVVAVGNWFGDPVAIYYSGRRGWGFPPPSLEYDWSVFPDDDMAIRLFEDLRANGGDWFGIVNQHYEEIWREHPKFAAHIEQTCVLTQSTPSGMIYRIMSPDESLKHSAP